MFSSQNSQVSSAANYIEDVFSTYLYTGNGSTQTITNGVDLAGKGGMVWIKGRDTSAQSATSPNRVFDTLRGAGAGLVTNTTAAQGGTGNLSSFNSTGFSLDTNRFEVNGLNSTYASWTFREQPKFFDVVTYTGDGVDGKAIAHNLGSVPGCIIVKRTDSTNNWVVWHTSSAFENLKLNTTAAASGGGFHVYSSSATTFDVYNASGGAVANDYCNVNGATYVAYLFAHDAGGFGLTGTDNVISCGSFTTDGSGNADVNLGYEPQWVLTKPSSTTGNWTIVDSMRGNPVYIPATNNEQVLFPNTSAAESSSYGYANTTSTGFVARDWGATPITFIYIAIRRGPMKVPTSGTSVFNAFAGSDTSAITTNFPVDFFIENARVLNSANSAVGTRLLGGDVALVTSSTAATQTGFFSTTWYQNNTSYLPACFGTAVAYAYQRAPNFFDVVCYTGNGANQTLSHNLQAVPELIICKSRTNGSGSYNWSVTFNFGASSFNEMYLNAINAATTFTAYNTVISAQPTSTTFAVGSSPRTGASSNNYVAYLFATCAGVSKVGSYTGTGATLQIDCGFTGGARFVLIKRTDSTGDWYVWDTARGMVAGTDPKLALNLTSAESNANWVYTTTGGFQIVTNNNSINASGGTYIYLAIA